MSALEDGWINHLRTASRQETKSSTQKEPVACGYCKEAIIPFNISAFKQHYEANHHGKLTGSALQAEFDRLSISSSSLANPSAVPASGPTQTPSSRKRGQLPQEPSETSGFEPGKKKIRSPSPSETQPSPPKSRNPTQTARSRARIPDRRPDSDFDRGDHKPSRTLFDPNSGASQKSSSQSKTMLGKPHQHQPKQPPPQPPPAPKTSIADNADNSELEVNPERPHTSIQPQPKTKPISQDQLVAEVKGIYAGLVMIEGKCIEVDGTQSRQEYNDLNSDQWTALVSLHRTLLHEHHDFFLASQHPSANVALRRLASKYAMPARMWRHGIHSFLEVLRHKLPHSYEHMLAFIYTAYSMMALLYETVPAFEDTWIECLGDLARYRMAIEDVDVKDRETWTGVARHWYSCASDKAPTTGRLYHHLAILARPNAIQQLCYYTKSLCVPIPFPSARESIMTLFDPILKGTTSRLPQIDAAYVRVHAILFSGKEMEQLEPSMEEYLGLLDAHIGRVAKRFLEVGYNIAIPLVCSLIGYGEKSHFMMQLLTRRSDDSSTTTPEAQPDDTFKFALSFAMKTFEIILKRWGDLNCLPFIHSVLVFIYHASLHPEAMAHIDQNIPWSLMAVMLNYLHQTCGSDLRIDSPDFPGAPHNDTPRPLPEDYKMRGLIYAEDLFPVHWFTESRVEEDEKQFELPSMTDQRKERIIWLGRRVARSNQWLTWNEGTRQFGVAATFAASGEGLTLAAVLPLEQKLDHDMEGS